MATPMQVLCRLSAVATAAASLVGQAVLHVPAAYAQISAAIAAAQPGDVIEVATGTYEPFTCNKGVTVAAAPGATVVVNYVGPTIPAYVLFHVPVGQMARVRRLRFVTPTMFTWLQVWVTGGRVAFESCTFEADTYAEAGLHVVNSAVWMRDCLCTGNTAATPGLPANVLACAGLRAQNSFVAAVDCRFEGGVLGPDGFGPTAGDGVHATGSFLHLVRCTMQGGASYSLGCFYPNGNGVRLIAPSGTWLVDCSVQGGSSPWCPQGGDALHNSGAVPVHLTRVTTIPGSGTVPGLAVVGPTVADQALGLAAATTGAALGSLYRIDYQATANAPIALLASLELVAAAPVLTIEATWLPGGAPLLGFLFADGQGLATFQTPIPNAPVLRHLAIWLHAIELGSAVHAAPPIGGVLH